MNLNEKNVFIIQNTELGSHLPLSVYLTELLQSSILLNSYKINLIISKSESIPPSIINQSTNIFSLNTNLYSIKNNIKFSYQTFKILKKQNKIKKIDVIHCLYPNSSLLPAVIFKIFINKNVKIIYDVRSPWIEMSFARKHIKNIFSPIIKYFIHQEEKLLMNWANYFVFITEGLKDYYINKYKLNNIKHSIIPSGVNTGLFSYSTDMPLKKYGITQGDNVIGIVSTLGKEREYEFIIRAFKKLAAANYKLVFIGDGPDKSDLESLAKILDLSDKIIFTGKIPHQDVPKYISNFDVGICHLPDIFVFKNSFPLKILEYLSCGISVLASDIKAHCDIANELNNVYIYKNESDFIRLITENNFITDKINNQNLLQEKFDWNSLNKRYVVIYSKI